MISDDLPTATEIAQSGRLAQLRPTFTETGHEPPPTLQPLPPPGVMAYVDVGVLLLALCAASAIALRWRSRRWMVMLTIASALYFGFYRHGCVCPVGAIQNIVSALADRSYTVPLSVVLIFSLPLLFALFFGRTFCAGVCPLGALQALVVIRARSIPLVIRRPLELIPWLYLVVAVLMAAAGGGYLICRYDPFIGIYRLGGSVAMLLAGVILLLVGTVIARPYCRFLCPYGALLGLCSRVSKYHVSITPADCIQCRLCEDACPYDAILRPTGKTSVEPWSVMRQRLIRLLWLLPVMVVIGFMLGCQLATPLSRFSDTVNLAEQVQVARQFPEREYSVEVDGFMRSAASADELIVRALTIRHNLHRGGGWAGGLLALVCWAFLSGLSITRRRIDYEPDRGRCFSCARCFKTCPVKPALKGACHV